METKATRQVRLISCWKQMHNGRALKPNDPFEDTEEEAASLIAIGAARSAPADTGKGTYKRRDMKAEK